MLNRRQRWVFAGATVTGAVVPLSLWVLGRGSRDVRRRVDEVSPAPAAVVLGCFAHPDGRPCLHLEDRLQAAVDLYRAGRVQRILASGDAGAAVDEVAAMARWLEQHGVPTAAILTDGDGIRTLASMRNAARVFGLHQVVVCTHRYHLPRSLYLAKAFGLEAQGMAADRAPLEAPVRTRVREFGARAMALLDLTVLGASRRSAPSG